MHKIMVHIMTEGYATVHIFIYMTCASSLWHTSDQSSQQEETP